MGTGVLENARKVVELTRGMSRAQELDWYRRELGIDDLPLLRLLGYRPADVAKRRAEGAAFEDLAEARPEQTIWVSELFRSLVDRFGYDMTRLAEALAGPPDVSGRPTGPALVREIQAGGPDVVRHLTEYLRRNPSPGRPRNRATSA